MPMSVQITDACSNNNNNKNIDNKSIEKHQVANEDNNKRRNVDHTTNANNMNATNSVNGNAGEDNFVVTKPLTV